MNKNEIKLDTRELEFPETVYVRDIENKVFQALVVKAIDQIEGVFLLEANLIGNFLNMGQVDQYKGIFVDQDSKNHSVSIKVELSIAYGLSIPEKALEVQSKISDEIVKFTGLHVGSVHVVFKTLANQTPKKASTLYESNVQEESEEFV